MKYVITVLLAITLSSCSSLPSGFNPFSDSTSSSTTVGQGIGRLGLSGEDQYNDSNVKNFDTTTRTVSETNLAKVVGQQNTAVKQRTVNTTLKSIDTIDLVVIITGILISSLLTGIVLGKLIPTRMQSRTYKVLLERLLDGK